MLAAPPFEVTMTRWSSKALLGAAVALVAGSVLRRHSAETVKFGVLTAMTGQYSDLGGQGSITAAQMAVEDFRAEAKPGFRIELVTPITKTGSTSAPTKYGVDRPRHIGDRCAQFRGSAASKVATERRRVVINTGAAERLTNEVTLTRFTTHTTPMLWQRSSAAASCSRAATAGSFSPPYFFAPTLTADLTRAAPVQEQVSRALRRHFAPSAAAGLEKPGSASRRRRRRCHAMKPASPFEYPNWARGAWCSRPT